MEAADTEDADDDAGDVGAVEVVVTVARVFVVVGAGADEVVGAAEDEAGVGVDETLGTVSVEATGTTLEGPIVLDPKTITVAVEEGGASETECSAQ